MGRAADCPTCKTDRHLLWKHINERQWWIVCEGCGSSVVNESKPTQREAGEHWNKCCMAKQK